MKHVGSIVRQWLMLPALLLAFCGRVPAQTVLTNAAQLRALTTTETDRKLPVKLRAVVTTFEPGRTVFLQDETGGTFLTGVRGLPVLTPGDVVEAEGVTHTGLFIPGIASPKVTIIGRAPIPTGSPVSFDDLLSTRWHYQRVKLGGIVRSVVTAGQGERLVLNLAMGARKLEVQLIQTNITYLPPLVDARISVTGLAAGYINDRHQLVAPHLLVNRMEDIQVEEPVLAEPYGVPLTEASVLLNFEPTGVSGHRVRMQGVVTHHQPGEAIYLRDGGRGLMVQTAQRDAVRPGDVVEVLGFPAMGRFSAYLEDAEFRLSGREPEPAPVAGTVTNALRGTYDVDLVSLEAQLLEVLDAPVETVLLLRAENTAFKARLPRTPLSLRNGSTVRITGVCRVEESAFPSIGFRANPRTIELLLRSPADIAVLRAPSWWTATRLAVAAGSLLVVAVGALAWAGMLRRRVEEQTDVIRQKVQREAALEERHRMAREMHDTLAQSFSGLGFQLDALRKRLPQDAEEAKAQLDTAQQLVRHGQEEFRRSLMNLRAQELERGSLADALPELARQITAGTGIELKCDVQPAFPKLAEAVENNLLRIGQECLTNAVRHGNPARVELSLREAEGAVALEVKDDGAGFELKQSEANGHFGLRGIRERAEQIRGTVEVESRVGGGTRVRVVVKILRA